MNEHLQSVKLKHPDTGKKEILDIKIGISSENDENDVDISEFTVE